MWKDYLRQFLNIVGAIGEIAFSIWSVNTTMGVDISEQDSTNTFITPAGYAFSIWSLIYFGVIVYAIYQALPAQRENPLLRKIGWATAFNFLLTCAWLVASQFQYLWVTVAIIFTMLALLVYCLIQFIRHRATITPLEQIVVVLPISIFAGWITVASVANTAAALVFSGFENVLLADPVWAGVMVIIAGVIAAFTTYVTRGNRGYALAVIWAIVAIAVANVERNGGEGIPYVAVAATGLVGLALLLGQTLPTRQQQLR